MRVLTNADIKKIMVAIEGNGFHCSASNGGDNAIVVSVDWVGYFGNALSSGIEAVCFFIRNTGLDVRIDYLNGNDDSIEKVGHYEDGIRCWVNLRVTGI